MGQTTNDNILDRLEHSTMFHLSLGSKELFHSNFLYWLSIVDWESFLIVMRGLAKVDSFWWEQTFKHSNETAENQVEVRRESHNFDLSIYVKTSKEKRKDGEVCEVETWIPVLVLENKMKSLPRHAQLQEYTEKAFNEWKQKKSNYELAVLWKEQPISFVLLSLFIDEDFSNNCSHKYEFGRKQKQLIQIDACWEKNNYADLYGLLNSIHLKEEQTSLNQKILEDYSQFVCALHELAIHDWLISEDDSFVEKIYPWAIDGYSGDRQVRLRIDDIRQKVHYAQLKSMLEKALRSQGLQVTEAPFKRNDSDGLYYGTNFAHNIGILEVAIKQGDESIFLQLQGHSYAHAFALSDNKDAASRLIEHRLAMEPLFEFAEEDNDPVGKERITTKYPEILHTNELYPQGVNPQAIKKKRRLMCFKYFGQGFVYQNVLIPRSVTIGQVIQAMVEDTKKCLTIHF